MLTEIRSEQAAGVSDPLTGGALTVMSFYDNFSIARQLLALSINRPLSILYLSAKRAGTQYSILLLSTGT